ncbi:cell division ATP-binding protein FtsE [Nitrosospira multiformis]|uniref:Cell division ATP-binding protein FtsE n=2 Tax=Nitrosospira multiformis TaxID=1231 RepID=Q2Y5E5_NITMU|nr:cell division ATP-binding protein FtsE [Nitrosospira multiformis]ABB76026.1 cell division ATP-binding protein FtsE [Nitrosospira multiformis ATCC 25196]SEA46993.1 cell division ATP-binding protein FtsE [Nitrosospira multiformis]SEF78356.1 cell division ATP-binding protein FtsE [Nitrosospira multiformis ATCC 25196]SEO09892.1 cell division ATP-binding protein FtsE [Nitrosospira multiformis]
MISFSEVSKRYPNGFEALRNVSFTVETGEMALINGHSGAGKTTLLRLIAAIERSTTGSVIVNGQDVGRLNDAAVPFLRRNFGLVFQDQKLLFDRSVFENVLLPLQISGFESKAAVRRVRAALDKVGLLNKEKARPITLSGGEQQRLCIARAIVSRPSILIADEPTSNLDMEYAKDIMAIFKSFHQVGVTVLISTHDVELLGGTPQRILTLSHGELTG